MLAIDSRYWLVWIVWGAGLILGLVLSKRLGDRWRTGLRAVVALLAVRLLLLENPASWELYRRVLDATEVGWRQSSVITVEARRFRPAASVPYLAVGSSQSGAMFRGYASSHPELDTLTMADLYPLDYVLYQERIERRAPRTILLYLSDFDLARAHRPERLTTAPRQGLGLIPLWAELRRFPEGRAYHGAFVDLAVGELLPEYKYRFVCRGLVDNAVRRIAASPGRHEPPARDRASADERARMLREELGTEHIELNVHFLERFVRRQTEAGRRIAIVEGRYNPVVETPRTRGIAAEVRRRLERLAEDDPGVRYIPSDAVMRLDESDYRDLGHVRAEVGREFTRRLLARLGDEGESTVPAPRDPSWWSERVAQLEREMSERPAARLVFVGDSITESWATEGAETWERAYAGYDAVNLGVSGDRTQHLLWRLQHMNSGVLHPEVAVVLIGTNNLAFDAPDEIVAGVDAVVAELRRRWPDTSVLLLGLLPRGIPTRRFVESIDRVNEGLAERAADPRVRYLDVGDRFLLPDGSIPPALMHDGLHLTGDGYEVLARAIGPRLDELLASDRDGPR